MFHAQRCFVELTILRILSFHIKPQAAALASVKQAVCDIQSVSMIQSLSRECLHAALNMEVTEPAVNGANSVNSANKGNSADRGVNLGGTRDSGCQRKLL